MTSQVSRPLRHASSSDQKVDRNVPYDVTVGSGNVYISENQITVGMLGVRTVYSRPTRKDEKRHASFYYRLFLLPE